MTACNATCSFADPPQALMNVLSRAKWDIVAALRRHEIERRRPLIVGWIKRGAMGRLCQNGPEIGRLAEPCALQPGNDREDGRLPTAKSMA